MLSLVCTKQVYGYCGRLSLIPQSTKGLGFVHAVFSVTNCSFAPIYFLGSNLYIWNTYVWKVASHSICRCMHFINCCKVSMMKFEGSWRQFLASDGDSWAGLAGLASD